jgi:outer membrane receptor protein involved in Fe transport
MKKAGTLIGAGIVAMAAAMPAAASAQDDPARAATAAEAGVGDIIVTARKRQESVLEVPVVTSIITQEQIDSRQIADLTDISTLTPGLLLGEGASDIGTQISIRGVGTTAIDSGIDQSISLNLDGLQITQGSAYSVGVFDMAQVEVLKGPQALFFGKNSPGGVVSIRTADPGDRLEVIGRLGYEGKAREWRGDAIISAPLTETLGLRIAARYDDMKGFFRNTAVASTAFGAVQPPKRFGDQSQFFLRGTVVFKPSPRFQARLKLNYTRDRQKNGSPFQLASCPEGTADYLGIPGLSFYSPNEDCKVDRRLNLVDLDPAAYGGLPNNGKPFNNIDQYFGTLQMDYDLSDGISLTSVSGYYHLKYAGMINGSLAGNAGTGLAAQKTLDREEYTQELRLNSDFAGPLNFTAGGFYQNGRIDVDSRLAGNTTVGLPAELQSGTHHVDIESISVFGQLRYKLVPDLELAGGVRWTDERRSDHGVTSRYGGPFVPLRPPSLSTRNWSPELTLTWTPTDDLTLFGSLKQGYKSGSYNLIVPIDPDNPDNSFGDEKVQGGEIGLKTRLANRQIFTNLAFYYYKYKGLQVGVNEPAEGGLAILRTVNAGAARVYGVDFDFSYRPETIAGLSLNGAIDWNRGRFTNFPEARCYGGQTPALGCDTNYDADTDAYLGQDLSGTPLPRAPQWQLTAGANYELPVGTGMKAKLSLDGQYSSKYLADIGLNRPDYYQRAFAKINATVSLSAADDRWELALIGNNLTNKLTTASCTNLNYAGGQVLPGSTAGVDPVGPAGLDELVCTFGRGRELWLRLTLRPFN